MGERFTYKGNDYRVDAEGNIYEDTVFGRKVGKMNDDGEFTIKTGVLSEEKGGISSWTGDVHETGFLGDKGKVGKKKSVFEICPQGGAYLLF